MTFKDWLSRLFLSRNNLRRAQLMEGYFEYCAPSRYEEFFNASLDLVDDTYRVCLENPMLSRLYRSDLESHRVRAANVQIPFGSYAWPSPRNLLVPCSPKVILTLRRIVNEAPAPELCSHFFILDGETTVLAWYSFPEGIIAIRKESTEFVQLCQKFDLRYSENLNEGISPS